MLTADEGVCEVTVVVPVLNDQVALRSLLQTLQWLAPATWEIVVVDGGSGDGSVQDALELGARVIQTEASRGLQLDEGIRASAGRLVWLLHADSRVDAIAVGELQRLFADVVSQGTPVWGRFDVRLEALNRPRGWALGLVAGLMNWRSRLTRICTGDQGIFASRDLLDAVGGVPRQALMEDIELSKRLKTQGRPLALRTRLGTSSRRWETRGIMRTIITMWGFRLRYFLGASPQCLARRYYQ